VVGDAKIDKGRDESERVGGEEDGTEVVMGETLASGLRTKTVAASAVPRELTESVEEGVVDEARASGWRTKPAVSVSAILRAGGVAGREAVSGCGRDGGGRTVGVLANGVDARSSRLEINGFGPGSEADCPTINESDKRSSWLASRGGDGRGEWRFAKAVEGAGDSILAGCKDASQVAIS
jgi:hypothetical protein